MTTKSILIADDELAIAKALELKLQKAGYTTVIATNGAEALKEIEKASFDLILLDILMPEVDGWEVLSKLKGKGKRILVTSNLGQEEDITRAKELGATDFLVKSDTPLSEIMSRVEEILK